MNKLEEIKSVLLTAINDLNNEMQQPGEILAYDLTSAHLTLVRDELVQMLREVESGQISKQHQQHAWIGRTVIDGWPLKHPLSTLILKAESAYLSLPGQLGTEKSLPK